MIVSHEYEFVMGTPTKCGTHSVESVVKRMNRQGDNSLRLYRSQHRMDLPEDVPTWYTRFLLVRHPMDRLVSTYNYLSDPVNYSQWGHKDVAQLSFPQFVSWFAKTKEEVEKRRINTHRSPHLWTLSLSQNADILEPDGGFVKIEECPRAWDEMLRICGVPDDTLESWPQPGHANKTRKRKQAKKRGVRDWYTKASLNTAMGFWGEDDCKRFNYPPL